MGRIDGKVALVTGGASGIGRATALTLAREGAKVVLTDIDDTGGRQVAAEIAKAGGEALYLTQDVISESRWQEVVAETEQVFGGLDILVNNAGVGMPGGTLDYDLARWKTLLEINLDGVFLGVKHSVPAMQRRGGGSIINLSSVAGLRGAPGLAAYNATKGGVRLFTKGVALEFVGDKIRVNSVHPGIIETPIWTKMDADLGGGSLLEGGANAVDTDSIAQALAPMGFAGEAQDIANGILFLASDESRYMTGTELVIDGGMTAK